MKIVDMTSDDLKRLEPEKLRQKSRMKTSIWVSIVLNVILWGLFAFVPSGEMLGYAVVGPIVAGVLLFIAYKSGKNLNLDLLEKKKQVIEGEIQLKSRTQFKNSTYFEFQLSGKKYPVNSKMFNDFEELESIIFERTIHGGFLLNCLKKA